MPFSALLAAPVCVRRKPDPRRPHRRRRHPGPPALSARAALIGGVLYLMMMLGGAVPAGAGVAGWHVPTSAPAPAPPLLAAGAGERANTASVALVLALADPQASSGFERALGLAVSGSGLVTPAPGHSSVARAAVRRPNPVARAIAAMTAGGDRIARLPYVYGGGHGSFDASGYDCSGSVSYVLHAAGLLSIPADSSGLESFGEPGPGRHVTIYANAQHALMTIDGRRFDTIALQETGTRWASSVGPTDGYVERHPPGM